MLLGLDHDHSFSSDALIAQREYPFFHGLGKGGGPYVKAQVHCTGHLVHILAACALGTDCGDVDFFQRDCQDSAHKIISGFLGRLGGCLYGIVLTASDGKLSSRHTIRIL